MSVFEIDNFHPLSAYHVDEEKNESIMNSTFKKFLFKPNVLEGVFEPNELKRTFEIAFELELMGILAEITSGICKHNDISLPEKILYAKTFPDLFQLYWELIIFIMDGIYMEFYYLPKKIFHPWKKTNISF